MVEPSSEPSRNKRQHARGKSVDVGALSLSMMKEDGDAQPSSETGRRALLPGRAKSMDFRGLDLEEIRDASLLEDGSAKALYKNALREKAMRKGRIFQPLAPSASMSEPPPHTPLSPTADPVEAAFDSETKSMEKDGEKLEVEIFGLEQEIRMMTRALEQKAKALKDANAQLAAREREKDWWQSPGDVRPRAQRFPSDNSITGSPLLQPAVSPGMASGSFSPALLTTSSPAIFPLAEAPASPTISAASNPSFSPMMSVASTFSTASYSSSISSPTSCQSMSPSLSVSTSPALPPAAPLRHSASASSLRNPDSTSPLHGNPSVMFVVPTIPFPSSRATASSLTAPSSPTRRSPFRHLNKDR